MTRKRKRIEVTCVENVPSTAVILLSSWHWSGELLIKVHTSINESKKYPWHIAFLINTVSNASLSSKVINYCQSLLHYKYYKYNFIFTSNASVKTCFLYCTLLWMFGKANARVSLFGMIRENVSLSSAMMTFFIDRAILHVTNLANLSVLDQHLQHSG